MTAVRLEDLSKEFRASAVVRGVNLDVASGEFLSLLGPSGCGKTTTLRMIAGFEKPSGGRILMDGHDVTAMTPSRRQIGMVFQSYALFPNLSVGENVAFGLKVTRTPRAEIATRVQDMLALVGLPKLSDRYPHQLSGGQQQRVALARALAVRPTVLLLDEPLSALDAKIRVSLRDELRSLQRELGITTLYVTHDQEEALSMSTRICVMSEGRVEQVGTPAEVYGNPQTRFVASFVGTINVLNARVVDPAAGVVAVGDHEIRLPRAVDAPPGTRLSLGLRPEAVSLSAHPDGSNMMSGVVEQANFLGAVTRTRLRCGDTVLSVDRFSGPESAQPRPGERVTAHFPPAALFMLRD